MVDVRVGYTSYVTSPSVPYVDSMLTGVSTEEDFLRYPISLLVITALTESIQRLTALRLSDSECEFCILKERIDVDDLMIGTGTAIEDVRELSGWREVDVDGCTGWIGGLVGEAERSGRRGVLSPEEDL